jgi:hypothetical protein
VQEIISPSQRAQTQPRAAREPQAISLNERLALSPREFAAALGKSATFGYRAIYRGWVRPISDAGRLLIPRSEIDRFLARATEYNPKGKGDSAVENRGEAWVDRQRQNAGQRLSATPIPLQAKKTSATAEAGSEKRHSYTPLPTRFHRAGFDYRQIAREADTAIYEQSWNGSRNPSVCYEVIRVKRREGFEIGGRWIPPAEVYPNSEAWGVDGFTVTDKDAAFAKLREISKW